MAQLIGVDEAGRGPVLGSMFVVAVAVTDPAVLPADVADSKSLTERDRARLAGVLSEDDRIDHASVEVTPAMIDDASGRLNHLTAATAARAIVTVLDGSGEGSTAVVDACDTDEARYADSVRTHLPSEIEVVAEHGADRNHRIVSAASILAKDRRERHVASLATQYGDVGSGYPSDPTTRAFLADYVEEHGELPACARASWGTSQDLLAKVSQGTLEDF